MNSFKKKIINIYGREPENLDDLAQCVISVISSQDIVVYNSKKRINRGKIKVVGFKWDVLYSELVSNSHSSPMDGAMNFSRKENLPTGYPGWAGRVWIRYGEAPPSFGSDPFRQTLTYTGTGGYGSYNGPWERISLARYKRYGHQRGKDFYPEIYCYGWDYRFYASDWPQVEQDINAQLVYHKLAGTSMNRRHVFEWNDPDQMLADAEFMNDCKYVVQDQCVEVLQNK